MAVTQPFASPELVIGGELGLRSGKYLWQALQALLSSRRPLQSKE